MGTLHVACNIEGDYVVHSAAMLHSVLEHAGGHDVHVHYLHGPGLDRPAAERVREMVERAGGALTFVGVPDERTDGLPVSDFTRQATWYRIFLPDLLPDLDRVLFLDADLIVGDSLAPLWETDVSGHYLAAVSNVFQPDHLFRPAELGIDDPRDYFNAGVLLLNLELMRRDRCSEAMREFAVAQDGVIMFRDQDVLNAVVGRRRLALHPRWNVMNATKTFPWSTYVFGARALEDARRSPGIHHFEGPGLNKPWHFYCRADGRELYIRHRRATPWPEVELEGRPPRGPRRVVHAVRRRISA